MNAGWGRLRFRTGRYGGAHFTPIINRPEVAILALPWLDEAVVRDWED